MSQSFEGGRPGSHFIDGRWLVGLAVMAGAGVLLVAIGEEPYHIDELRQVRYYDAPLRYVVAGSANQQQPPLDPVLNALIQRWIGVGDVKQRLLSVVCGMASLGLVGWLTWRSGMRLGASVSVLVMASSALLVDVTAYARPYALPVLLMLLYTAGLSLWLEERRLSGLVLITFSGVLLPLSRTVEPTLFLVATVVVLAIDRWKGDHHSSWQGSLAPPVAVSLSCLFFIAIPTLWALSAYMVPYTPQGTFVSVGQVARLITEFPVILGEAFPFWPAAMGLIVFSTMTPRVRSLLVGQYWWWPLALVPLLFAMVFSVRSAEAQPYFPRYAFSFVVPFAVLCGAVADDIHVRWRAYPSIIRVIAAGLLALTLGMSSLQLREALTTESNADWREAADAVELLTERDTVVLFDDVRPFGGYRSPFAGQPRYLSEERQIPGAEAVARNPERVPLGRPIVVLLLGARPQPDGWTFVPVGKQFALYLPGHDDVRRPRGPEGAVRTYVKFGTAIGGDGGYAMLAAAVGLLEARGERGYAQRLISKMVKGKDEDHRSRIEQQLIKYGHDDLVRSVRQTESSYRASLKRPRLSTNNSRIHVESTRKSPRQPPWRRLRKELSSAFAPAGCRAPCIAGQPINSVA